MGRTLRELAQEPRPVVLAVDDDLGLLEALGLVLGEHYEVLTALSGSAALEIVRSRPVDAVILDILMPGMDGFQVLEHIKATDPGLEVILLTGLKHLALGVTGMRHGALDCITKPFDEESLLATVVQAVKKRHRTRGHALLIGSDAAVLASFAPLLAPYASVVTAAPVLACLPDPARGTPHLVMYDSDSQCHLAAEFAQSLRERFARSAFVTLKKPYRLDEVLRDIARVTPSLGQLAIFSARLGPHLIKLIDHVAQSYRRPLDASDLAGAVGLSVDRLAHLVRERLGVALMEYVTRFRVEVARHLIAVTDLTIEKVGERAGFASASHLSRAFLSYTGYRPGEYRRRGVRAGRADR